MTYTSRIFSHPKFAAAAVLAVTTLSACGGGDGEQSVAPTTVAAPAPTPETSPPAPALPEPPTTVSPACNDCGAVNANTYTGNGVGVWQAINASTTSAEVPIRIEGLNGQDVTLVFTNQTATPRIMPTISLTTPRATTTTAANALRWNDDGTQAVKQEISDFNREGWVALAGRRGDMPNYAARQNQGLSAVNTTRTWYHADNSERSATLVLQRATTDGTAVNFWVEDSENASDRVSTEIVALLADSFTPAGRLYDMVTAVGGPLWGPHEYSNLIPATGQPLDIVILNFNNDGRPLGLLGYFYGRNALSRNPETNPYSNESVSLYLDAESLYLGGPEGQREMISTMAHEAMHLQSFYRRGVVKGPSYLFGQWLEEASAMMMENFVGHSIDPNYNAIRDVRFPDYIGYGAGSYNCSLIAFKTASESCDSYAVSGSLGGFLTRQFGLDFYKNLLNDFSSTDSIEVLDSAIRASAPTSGFGEQLRRFAATAGSLMTAPSPDGFGFPARTEGGFTLPLINPQAHLPTRTLIQSVAVALEAYGSLPVVRTAVSGTYDETVSVPAGTTLSVVIQ
ncbi:M30 family zinc metallopeptidase [Cupriavidus pauculus]|uniref:Hemagglutinin n=1 Tax=Cupriavidus pauculus TaxID=82633 RepID=A0A2N5C534_9BURK|nr:hemagglutinin [Cupriavidus pauculus]PLP97331.1 hemagglutinin [Cupriavidus pauculus]